MIGQLVIEREGKGKGSIVMINCTVRKISGNVYPNIIHIKYYISNNK
jgi:hypothetical protein